MLRHAIVCFLDLRDEVGGGGGPLIFCAGREALCNKLQRASQPIVQIGDFIRIAEQLSDKAVQVRSYPMQVPEAQLFAAALAGVGDRS